MSSHILVPFILLGYEGRDEYGWISRKAIMKLSSERISSLEEEIFRDIQTKFAHIVDPVALDYYSVRTHLFAVNMTFALTTSVA